MEFQPLVLEEERFNHEKHTLRFPFLSLAGAFNGQGLDINDIDVITTPWEMKCFRQSAFSAVLGCLPDSLNLLRPSARSTQSTLIVNMPIGLWWGLKWKFGFNRTIPGIVQVRHHDAHAASFFISPFEEAAVLVTDGYGDETATSAYTGSGNRLQRLWQSNFFDSLGMLYTCVTKYLGFGRFEEGTVMALAATGCPTYAAKFRELIHLKSDVNFRSIWTSSATTPMGLSGLSREFLLILLGCRADQANRLLIAIAISLMRSSPPSKRQSCTSFARFREVVLHAICALVAEWH